MRTFTARKRLPLVGLVAAAVLAVSAGVAFAVFPNDSVDSYAGCLNTSGAAAGTFSQVTVGDSPARPCGANQTVVHLSGGDITSVNAGPGLTGGSTNGAATLSLAAGQSLPQTCTNDQVPKWNGSGWSCGSDNDTTFTNGTGLDLFGTTFSVTPSYRLPQNCASGQVAKSDGSNHWSCQSDESAQSHAYTAGTTGSCCSQDGSWNTVTTLNIPNDPGNYIVFASQELDGTIPGLIHPHNFGDCRLLFNGNVVDEKGEDVIGTVTEVAAGNLTVPGRIEVECRGGSIDEDLKVIVTRSRVVALKVGAIN
jgi:hypothetical protein